MIYIVMGVSGSGKSFIGHKLAKSLNLSFYEGDDFHPASNIKKMRNGAPLTDEDRWPWLKNIRRHFGQWERTGGSVLACSALKKSYRDFFRSASADVQFIYLKGSKSFIKKRMKQREGHFMPTSLLESQFKTLEEPKSAVTISVDKTPKEIVAEILTRI